MLDIFNSEFFNNSKESNSSDLYTVNAYKAALQQKNLDVNTILDSETKKILRKSFLQKKKLSIAKNVISILKTSKDVQKKQQCVDAFDNFYKTCFCVTDYTVQSFAKSNSSNENLTLYSEMFNLINSFKKPINPNVVEKTKATTKK